MRIVERTITVRWQFAALHRWPEATGDRAYLADPHRHLFVCELTADVQHADREIEFHDLLQCAKDSTPGSRTPERLFDLGRMSCEELAEHFIERAAYRWRGRAWTCSVYEDGECGATITAEDT